MREDWRNTIDNILGQDLNVTIELFENDFFPSFTATENFLPDTLAGRDFQKNFYYDCPPQPVNYHLAKICKIKKINNFDQG